MPHNLFCAGYFLKYGPSFYKFTPLLITRYANLGKALSGLALFGAYAERLSGDFFSSSLRKVKNSHCNLTRAVH